MILLFFGLIFFNNALEVAPLLVLCSIVLIVTVIGIGFTIIFELWRYYDWITIYQMFNKTKQRSGSTIGVQAWQDDVELNPK